ncbi:MAG: FAD-dependent oxidoreductase [Thermoanaerobaculia bacterium]
MRIAIIGTGISGLVVAHLLHEEHDLTLFEAQTHIGGHTLTTEIDVDGERFAVDAGFVVFNQITYPSFIKLLDRLGVQSQPTTMSFSVKCEETGLEYSGTSLNTLFAQRRNLVRWSFLAMLMDIVRFNREARELLRQDSVAPTLRQFLAAGGYSKSFVEKYLVPMGAAIWSASPDSMLDFPASFFLSFLDNHGLLTVDNQFPWRVIRGGSERYVEALSRPFRDRIRLKTPVRGIRRHPHHVELKTAEGPTETYDQVIVASHSDQALDLLEDPCPEEREILGAIPYQPNEAVLHTDTSVLPRNRRAWASWNYQILRETGNRVVVTYNMNRLQSLDSPETFCVSLNLTDRIDPDRILRRFHFSHPLFTPAAVNAQRRHAEISGQRRTHYCGAYWRNGFHEDGVWSGLQVGRFFGKEL